MIDYEALHFALEVLAAVCAVLAVCLIPVVLRSKRRLDQRIQDFRRELAERQGPPPDPWRELAEIYGKDGPDAKRTRDNKRGQ